jgi:hypothetical protein
MKLGIRQFFSNRQIPCDLCGVDFNQRPLCRTELSNYFCRHCIEHLNCIPVFMGRVIRNYLNGNVI